VRGFFSLLLGLVYLPMAALLLPGLLLLRSAQDSEYVARILVDTGLFTTVLDGLEQAAAGQEALRRAPEPLRRALFSSLRQALPPELCRAEVTVLHAAALDWLSAPDRPFDYRLDLGSIRDDATTIFRREATGILAALPTCPPGVSWQTLTCRPAETSAEVVAGKLVTKVASRFPETLSPADAEPLLDRSTRVGLATALSLVQRLAVGFWFLLVGIPLLILLINLNHAGRLLRRPALVLLVSGLLAVLLVHLARISACQEVDDQTQRLVALQPEVLAPVEAQISAVGRRLVGQLSKDLLVWPYVVTGGAAGLLLISFFFGGPRPEPVNGVAPPPAPAAGSPPG